MTRGRPGWGTKTTKKTKACIGIISNMFFITIINVYFYRLTQLPNTNVSWSSIINPLVALLKRFVCGRGAMCGVNNSQMRRGNMWACGCKCVSVCVCEYVCGRVLCVNVCGA